MGASTLKAELLLGGCNVELHSGTISTTLTVSTKFATVLGVLITFAESVDNTAYVYWTASGGTVTITGTDKAVTVAVFGYL